jgi:hypothetical protein
MKQSILFDHIKSIVEYTEKEHIDRMYALTRLPSIMQFINDNELPVMGSNLYVDSTAFTSTSVNSDDDNTFTYITVYTNSRGNILAETLFNKLCTELIHEPLKYYPELINSDLYTYDIKLHFSTVVRFIALNDEHFRRVRENNCIVYKQITKSTPFKYVINPNLYLIMVYKDLCNPMEKHTLWNQRYNEMIAIETQPIGAISGKTDITVNDVRALMSSTKPVRMREQLLSKLPIDNTIIIGQYALALLLDATLKGSKGYQFDCVRPTVELMTNRVADTIDIIKKQYPKDSLKLKTYDSNNEFRMFKSKTAIIENGTVLYEIYDSSDSCIPFNTVPFGKESVKTVKIGSPHLLLMFMYINVTNSYLIGYRERIKNNIELLKALRVWYLQYNELNGYEESLMKVLHRTCMGRQINSEQIKKIKKWNGELKLRYNKKCSNVSVT